MVSGSLRATDSLLATNLVLSGSQAARSVLAAPTSAGAPSFRTLTNADVGLSNVTNDAQVKASLGTAKGDMLYWSASATPARLAIGTAGYTLQATANGPAWTQTVAVGNGGTGKTSWTKGGIIYASDTNALSQIADGTASKVLKCSGSASYSWLSYTSTNTGNTLVSRDSNGNFSAGTITASLTGNADTATKLTNISSSDAATSTTTRRYVWFCQDDNAGGRPNYDTNLTYQTSTGTMRFKEWIVLPYGGEYGTGGSASFWYNGTSDVTASGETANRMRCNKNFQAAKVYAAVWNDYAEYRRTLDSVKPGQVVIDNDDGSLSITTRRLQPGAQAVSDTYGFSIGEMENTKTPLAVSGRVLVYTYRSREEYHAGQAVCSAPNGTVDIMTREEIRDYPDAIIGIVSEIPQYKTWGTGNVEVDGRIWIKIK